MSRRRRKRDNTGLGVLIGLACCYSVYKFLSNNVEVSICLLVLLNVVVALSLVYRARRRRKLLEAVDQIIAEKAQGLAKRRAQLVRPDAYGKPLFEKWNAEVDYFIREHVVPTLKADQQSILHHIRQEVVRRINLTSERYAASRVFASFSDSMAPTDFEAYCAERLRECGWNTHLTPTTGDQGVDIVADKDGLRVVVQCKLYSGSVGNGAVQEVVAGRAYERAHYAAVVSNSTYTAAAEQLAHANGVLLLHYSDLCHLEALVRQNASGAFPASDYSVRKEPELAPESSTTSTTRPADSPRRFVASTAAKLVTVAALVVALGLGAILLLGSKRQPTAVILDTRLPKAHFSAARHLTAKYTTYTDDRFGFQIDYPQSFSKNTAAADTTFSSPDGAATLVLSEGGSDGIATNDLYSRYVASVTGDLGYQHVADTWFVVTWRDGHNVAYHKTFVGSAAQASFTFTFPEAQRSTYEPITTRLERSFRPGDLDEAQ